VTNISLPTLNSVPSPRIFKVALVSEDAGAALSRDFFGYAEVNQAVHVEAVKENVCAPREPLQTVADCTAT
jgi:hypothetical protein